MPPATQVGQATTDGQKRNAAASHTLSCGERLRRSSPLVRWTKRPRTARKSRAAAPCASLCGDGGCRWPRRWTSRPRAARRSGLPRPTRPRAGKVRLPLVGQEEDQAAADGHQKKCRRAPHVLVWGWKLPLATQVYQSAADGKKRQAAAPHASSRGERAGRWSPAMEMRPGDRGRLKRKDAASASSVSARGLVGGRWPCAKMGRPCDRGRRAPRPACFHGGTSCGPRP